MLPMSEAASFAGFLGLDAMGLSLAVLVVTYGLVISERVNRAIAALLGGAAMILLGLLDQEAAIRGIDFNTLALLIGMMVIVGVARRCGMFQFTAVWTAKRVQAHPGAILAVLQLVTGVASALLDNVTTVLLIVPVTLVVVHELKLDPYRFLVAIIFASNIGGTATLIGDPPNILIGSAARLDFNMFLWHVAPIAVLVLAVQIGVFHLLWGRWLTAGAEVRARVMAIDEHELLTDRRLLVQSLAVIALVLAAFVLGRSIGLEPGTTALTGAALLLLLDTWGESPEAQSHGVQRAFAEVEWVTIFFFVGLFVVVAAVERSGLLALFAEQLLAATGGDRTVTVLAVLWAAALLSAVVDNIPFVATMIPLIKAMEPAFGGPQGLEPLWWALSLGACFGGNGTLVGASANLTVAGLAERAGHPIRFMRFLWLAFPMMLLSIVLSSLYLWLRYLV